MINTRTT